MSTTTVQNTYTNTVTESFAISASSQAYTSLGMIKIDGFAVQINVTAASSPIFEFKLQVSNDDTNWIDLPLSTISITANDNHMIEVTEVNYNYMRCYVTRTSGSATVATIISKAVEFVSE